MARFLEEHEDGMQQIEDHTAERVERRLRQLQQLREEVDHTERTTTALALGLDQTSSANQSLVDDGSDGDGDARKRTFVDIGSVGGGGNNGSITGNNPSEKRARPSSDDSIALHDNEEKKEEEDVDTDGIFDTSANYDDLDDGKNDKENNNAALQLPLNSGAGGNGKRIFDLFLYIIACMMLYHHPNACNIFSLLYYYTRW